MKPEYRLDRHPIVLLRPRLSHPYSWVGHIPFAYLLVDLMRPRSFVELGTHSGNSYLAICQAVAALGLDTRCTAIDSWEGDVHALHYGSDVLSTLRTYHDPRYGHFSALSKKYFEDAVADFEDGTIDLLHIDGLHTYEAVKSDFETWLPKLSDRAVVILHDSEVRERDFGVWKYAQEIAAKYRTFQFTHSNGLTIVEVGSNISPDLKAFMDHALENPADTRLIFEKIASTLLDEKGRPADASVTYEPVPVVCQLYFSQRSGDYSESNSFQRDIVGPTGSFQLEIDVREVDVPAFIRVDFSETPGVFGLTGVQLLLVDGSTIPVESLATRVISSSGALLTPSVPGSVKLAGFDHDPYVEMDIQDISERITSRVSAVRLSLEYDLVINDPVLWGFVDKVAEVFDEVRVSHSAVATIAATIEKFSSDVMLSELQQHSVISATNEQLHQLTLESTKSSEAFATVNTILSELTAQMHHLLRQTCAIAEMSKSTDERASIDAAKNTSEVISRAFEGVHEKLESLSTRLTVNAADAVSVNSVLAEVTTQLHALCNQVSRSATDTGMMNGVLTQVTASLHQLGVEVSRSSKVDAVTGEKFSGIVSALAVLGTQSEGMDGNLRELLTQAQLQRADILAMQGLIKDQSRRIDYLQEQQAENMRLLAAFNDAGLIQRLKRILGFRQ